jgi:hypothetical protein
MMADDANGRRKDAVSAFLENATAYGRKPMEFGFVNASATFEALGKLWSAKTLQEYIQTLTDLTREHFERSTEQIEELFAPITPSSQPKGNDRGGGFWD